jgi:hypothetical protein
MGRDIQLEPIHHSPLSAFMNRPFLVTLGFVFLFTASELRAQATSPPTPFEQRVAVQAERKRSLRTAGGDFDDKRDQLTFSVKLTNNDAKQSFAHCKAAFYVFAQSIVDRRAYKLLGVDKVDFSLAPRGVHAFSTKEVVSQYDTTGARFGARYDGWMLVVRDDMDNIVMKKGSTPTWMPVADRLHTVTVGKFYDKTLMEMPIVR